MNQDYVDTVRFLLAIAPAVFQSPRFALKGGTALNLFLQDMPRLSVDIDVVFTDHTLDREAALRAIAADLKAVKSAISAMGYRADLPTTKSGDDVKLFRHRKRVPDQGRSQRRLPRYRAASDQTTADRYGARAVHDRYNLTRVLYGSKLVAAMDRQHPRDIFDVFEMLERFGWQSSFVDCFVAYLAGHNRPVHEVLFPKKLPLEPAFTNEFAGMTRDEAALNLLDQTQESLITQLPRALSSSHRDFLLSVVRAEPRWDLMPFTHLQHLPALQWKLLNLRKLKTRDATRFSAQHEELESRFKRLS